MKKPWEERENTLFNRFVHFCVSRWVSCKEIFYAIVFNIITIEIFKTPIECKVRI